jgi:oxygen-dependent protoporphyrinogen oxidase
MIRALTLRLPGDAIRLNTSVRRLSPGDSLQPFTIETDAGVRLTSRAVVLATPAFVTGALIRDVDVEVARLCGEIPYASTATVILGFRRADIAHSLNGSGFVVPRVEKSGILAGSWMSSKWPNRAPAGAALLRTFVGGARDPRALENPDEELVRRSLAALRPLVGLRGDPILTRVYRWDRSTAQHEVGHAARVAAIDRGLARRPGVFVTGSGFRGVGIPDCIADGRATGRQVAAYLSQSDR